MAPVTTSEFRERVRAEVVTPDDAAYDEARKV
jgi:hypothetical protein